MSLTLGTAALMAGIGAAGNAASSGLQWLQNSQLQEDAQSFNAYEAQLARDFAAQEAATARAFNAEQAQLARDFESTKYQRTVADMEAAGINPASIGMVNASGGSPMANSSAPNAAAASSGMNSVGNSSLGNVITSAFNSAMLQSMQDEHFVKSLIERTAYHARIAESNLIKANALVEKNAIQRKANEDSYENYKADREDNYKFLRYRYGDYRKERKDEDYKLTEEESYKLMKFYNKMK